MGTKRAIQYWVIPPEADAEFVANMEDVLEVYSRPYDANTPVLCMDEQPVQLVEEVKCPIEATKDHPNVSTTSTNARGWRTSSCLRNLGSVAARCGATQKDEVDWATEMANLLEGRYADCEKVIVVCDNLNTHTKGAFYDI